MWCVIFLLSIASDRFIIIYKSHAEAQLRMRQEKKREEDFLFLRLKDYKIDH